VGRCHGSVARIPGNGGNHGAQQALALITGEFTNQRIDRVRAGRGHSGMRNDNRHW